MTIFTLTRLLKKNLIWLLCLPLISAVTAFFLTMGMPGQYETSATLYTGLASGVNIRSAERNIDFYAVNSSFDNIVSTLKSRETIGQAGKWLLAQHLQLKEPSKAVLDQRGFDWLREAVSDSVRQLVVVPGNIDSTYQRIEQLSRTPGGHPLVEVLDDRKSYYSYKHISDALKAKRAQMSDIIEVSYEDDDPAVTQQTLDLVIRVFQGRHMNNKTSEAKSVVQFYERKVQEAAGRLQAAESQRQSFGTGNEIINYEVQSSGLASVRNEIESGYQQELMRFRASKAALTALERRMTNAGGANMANNELQTKRAELAAVQNKLANAEVMGQSRKVIEQLQSASNRLNEELKETAQRYYSSTMGSSGEGVPQQAIVSEWLTKVIEYEESAARLGVFENRLKDYNGRFRKMAPLGSQLSHLDREVAVAEKEYMSLLNNLSNARLQQKNVEMAGPVTVMDRPEFPQRAASSKRWLIIAGAFFAMFLMVTLVVLIREWMNNRIQNSERAENLTGLPLAAAFPLIQNRYTNRLRYVKHSMLEQLRSAITIELNQLPQSADPRFIILFSTRPAQGKTWIGSALSAQFAAAGHRVSYLYPEGSTLLSDESTSAGLSLVRAYEYPLLADFVDTTHPKALLNGHGEAMMAGSDYVFLELPSLMETAIPANIVAHSDLSLMVVDAQSVWTKTDQSLSSLYKKAAQRSGAGRSNVLCVLNRVDLVLMDSLPKAGAVSHAKALPQGSGNGTVAIAKPA